ncbi:MAG: dihydroorotase [Clostridia bacterium]|nr:dihydroorotase [Clostridia bacterium]
MDCIIKNAKVYVNGKFISTNLTILNGKVSFSQDKSNESLQVFDFNNKIIIPGLVDVHTHLREPGFSYKETVKSGTEAALKSGYNTIFTMPNLNPVPDSVENLKVQQDIIDKDALINVYPFGAITVGEKGEELSDIDGMSDFVKGFSDDGRGVQSAKLMEKAMLKVKALDKIIVAHCEDNALLNGGYIHDGEYAKAKCHKGISSISESKPIERDCDLAERTKVKYHVCHVSAKESVMAIRNAKERGVNVTAETAPHYLVLDDSMLKESGNFKMNPPIRGKEDKLALIDGIKDGTIDMIATDHAPHSFEEKNKGLKDSLNGIVGLETAFPILYTYLVKKDIISLEKLVEIMSVNPAKRFNLDIEIKDGATANFAVFDLEKEYVVNPDEFYSKGKSTPFDGYKVYGKCIMNVIDGKIKYLEK